MFDLRNRRVCHNELYDIYFSRKQRAKCGPAADRLSCRISTKMDSQPCGGTIPNKPPQCVYSQLLVMFPSLSKVFILEVATRAFISLLNHHNLNNFRASVYPYTGTKILVYRYYNVPFYRYCLSMQGFVQLVTVYRHGADLSLFSIDVKRHTGIHSYPFYCLG